MIKLFSVFFIFFCATQPLLADPLPVRKVSQKNSDCSASSTAGEYPTYQVRIKDKIVFSPNSDGIVNAKISPSGMFIALSGGEINLIDIKKNEFLYGLVIIDCNTGRINGFLKGKPAGIKWWWKDDKGLSLYDGSYFRFSGIVL